MNESERKSFEKYISKVADAKLPLSAHTIMGWWGNFERAKRFFQSYLKETDAAKKLDYAISFFIFSYHLRDWIQAYENFDKNYFDEQWKKFIRNYPEIKISRDICNVSKHLKISKESVDKNFSLFWEYDPFVTQRSDWIINYGAGEKERLIELMRKVLNAWGEFIVDYLHLGKE